jgi:signal peptidase I
MSRVERHAAEEAAIKANSRQEAADADVTGGGEPKSKKRKRRLTPFGRFLDILGTLIILAALLACLGLTVPRFVNVQSYVVVSGSMEPTIPVGSLVYAKPVEPATLQQGDVIVFYSTNAASPSGGAGQDGVIPVTHRVVENHVEDGEIITKGDANTSADISPAAYINVVGKVFAHIPKLGYLAAPLASLPGKIGMVMVILAGFLLTEAGNRIKR